MAARLLTFQLLHSPATRSTHDLPLLVLVTENISEEQRALLTKEGAVVIPVENITRDWVHPKWERWSGVLAKLNIWKMTAYDKIAFLDVDSILFKQIDGIFTEPVTAIQQTKSDMPDKKRRDVVELPPTYMIAGIHDLWAEQNLPPTRQPGKDFYVRDNYMNAGFFVLAPSETMFNYYLALLNQPSAFDLSYPEQNLLNYAHRINGRMPWRDIGHHWNQKGTSRTEYQGGLKSVHQKWWVSMGDDVLDKYVAKVVAEMKVNNPFSFPRARRLLQFLIENLRRLWLICSVCRAFFTLLSVPRTENSPIAMGCRFRSFDDNRKQRYHKTRDDDTEVRLWFKPVNKVSRTQW
ncbi:nucleotide-diphospho-sugar transferase [Aspergillus fruticulosus]